MITYQATGDETPYYCKTYQTEIDYWQEQYKVKANQNKELYKELMEAKMRLLEIGIKIPKELKNTKVILPATTAQPDVHNHYYY